jgi:hypothetical protein
MPGDAKHDLQHDEACIEADANCEGSAETRRRVDMSTEPVIVSHMIVIVVVGLGRLMVNVTHDDPRSFRWYL